MTQTAVQLTSVSLGASAEIETGPIYDYFKRALRENRHGIWLSQHDTSIQFEEADRIIDAIADSLSGRGIQKGDRIGLCMPNAVAYPLFCYACWRQGIIVVGMTALYAEPMLRILIEESEPKLIVTMSSDDVAGKTISAAEGLCDVVVLSPDADDLRSFGQSGNAAPQPGAIDYKSFLSSREQAQPAPIDPDHDLALLQFTGGTTGKPKGTMLSHTNVSACIAALISQMPEFEFGDERFIVAGPFSHILGTALIMGTCTALASEMIIPDRFHPEETTKLILDKRITMVAGVPTMFQAIARSDAASNSDWPDLRFGFCGGAPLPPEIADEFQRVTGKKMVRGYGLSETASGVSFTPPSVDCPDYSVGFPLPNCRVEIRDPQDGKTVLPLGDVGEICFDGPQLMRGYWNRSDATDEAMKHGIFHTGDTGYLDEDGALFIVDRIKDIIIASGFNIYPSFVESAVYEHPVIAEAAVIGVKDEYRGETVKVVVAFKPNHVLTLEQLQEFLTDKLSPIEIPRLMEVMTALPKTAVGKIDKTKLS